MSTGKTVRSQRVTLQEKHGHRKRKLLVPRLRAALLHSRPLPAPALIAILDIQESPATTVRLPAFTPGVPMFKEKDLRECGIPGNSGLMCIALRAANQALASGLKRADILAILRGLPSAPADSVPPEFSVLAGILRARLEARHPPFEPRAQAAPWRQWGDMAEEDALSQMRTACTLPDAVRGALMPDAHVGYGLPIGGVLAVRGAVIPYAVGVDIACRVRLSILDMPVSSLLRKRERLIHAIEKHTRFGPGAAFAPGELRKHPVMDEDWNFSYPLNTLKDLAAKQLGTSGSGNHFVEFGELLVPAPLEYPGPPAGASFDTPKGRSPKNTPGSPLQSLSAGLSGLPPGRYLALVSHSGSRGTGEKIAESYRNVAEAGLPALPAELRHLAWLDLQSHWGQSYWKTMQLMGRYAAANHELIHKNILAELGAEALFAVENHHNFAWEEEYGGETLIVHRKGATPAGKNTLGYIPGSMTAPGFLVRGKGNEEALRSCAHGAGRRMSRNAAKAKLSWDAVQNLLAKSGVELLSGGLDEAPQAYKDIQAVMDAQADLVDIQARFEPRIVKMAPDSPGKRDYRKKPAWNSEREAKKHMGGRMFNIF